MAKKLDRDREAAVPRRGGESRAAGRPRARPARREHHGVLQGVQRADGRIRQGLIIPAVISIFSDRTFTFVLKTPPAAVLLKRAAKLAKGSGEPNKTKVGTVSRAQVKEIAQLKLPDLNANDIDAAMRIIEGTARSMGIEVEG